MKTGWESMWVGSIIYFIPFFFVLNPALLLQGNNPYLEALGLTGLACFGIIFICGGVQGYQAYVGDLRGAGIMEWPLRVLLVIGGFVIATPGGGIMPLSQFQITSLGLAILIPTVLVALVLQGPSPYLEGLGLMALAGFGTLFICGGIQGYQAFVGDLRGAGALEWPLRVLLVIGGFVVATPGGGIMPLSQWQVTSLGLAILIPTVLIALVLIRRQTLVPDQLRAP